MPLSVRVGLTFIALLAAVAPPTRAQGLLGDRPEPYTPVRPQTREQLNHAEALKQYGLGVFHEHAHRLLAAVRAYEEATHLDPEAAPPYRALVPLYLGLDRLDDALAACKKALDLDPGDYATWHLYARQLQMHSRPREAAAAFERALGCAALKEHPDLAAQIAFDLAMLEESLSEFDKAEAAYLHVIKLLNDPASLMECADITRDEIEERAADTFERLGRVSLRAGNHDKAKDYFVKARDKVKDRDPVRAKRLAYNLAELYIAQEEWKPALEALDEYLETLPQGTEAYRAKIKAMQKLARVTRLSVCWKSTLSAMARTRRSSCCTPNSSEPPVGRSMRNASTMKWPRRRRLRMCIAGCLNFTPVTSSLTACSTNWMRRSARRPARRTTMRSMPTPPLALVP